MRPLLAVLGCITLLLVAMAVFQGGAESPDAVRVGGVVGDIPQASQADLAELSEAAPRELAVQEPAPDAVPVSEADGLVVDGFEDVTLSLDAVALDGSARGLTLRIESADGLPMKGARVVLGWKAAWGDNRYEYGFTDTKGELMCNAQEVFQIEDLDVWPKDSGLHHVDTAEGTFADSGRPFLVRYRLPKLREVHVRVTDESGAPFPGATVEVDGRETLSMDTDVNRLVLRRDYDSIPVDERGEVRVFLEEAAFEFEAESEALGLRTEELVILEEHAEDPITVTLVLASKEPIQRAPSRPRRQVTKRKIKVAVVDAFTGEALSGSAVTVSSKLPFGLSNARVRTGPEGTVTVEETVSGRVRFVAAQHRGYAWAAVPIEPGVQEVEATIRLEPAQRVEGRAVTSGGAPVPGYAYLFAPRERLGLAPGEGGRFMGQVIGTLGTGPPGTFHFNKVSSAEHRIRFVPDDAALPSVSVVARGGDQSVVIVVDETPADLADVEGTVFHRLSRKPVAGVKVVLNSVGSKDGRTATTGEEGRFSIAGLEPGAYTAVVRRPSASGAAAGVGFFAIQVQTVTIPPGPSTLSLDVSPARRLSLLLSAGLPRAPLRFAEVGVFDASGQPVELQDHRGYPQGTRMDTTWQGRIDLLGLPAERVEVRVWLDTDGARERPADFRRVVDLTAPMGGLVELRF